MMYTVEQIMQAIGTLHESERRRLMRELAKAAGPEKGDSTVGRENDSETPSEADYVLIFDGGSNVSEGHGMSFRHEGNTNYGRFAILSKAGGERIVRQFDLGENVASAEAAYDSLIAGLESLLANLATRGQDPAHYVLEIRGESRLIMQQLQGLWNAHGASVQERKRQALSLLNRFGSYRLQEISRSQALAILGSR